MNRLPHHLARFCTCLSLGMGILTAGFLHGQTRTLIDCAGNPGGDYTDRGFYIPNYPGTTLSSITIYMVTPSGSVGTWPYQVGVHVTEGAYNGAPLDDFRWADVTLGNTQEAVTIQFADVPVTPGSTVCFRFDVTGKDESPDLVYSVPDFSSGCTDVIQTNGTEAPLSTFRRNGVKIQVVGEPYLNVEAGGPIQLAIDRADPGDIISVGPGTYNEAITLRSEVDVIGAGPGDTILEPSAGIGVYMNGITETEFAGFTVRPAPGSASTTGMRIVGGSPVVRGNHVTGFPDEGVEIWGGSTALVCGNRLEGNSDSATGPVDYNLIILHSTPLVTNNLIIGGQVGCYIGWPDSGGMQFLNNTVADNSSSGIWCYNSAPVLKNNLSIRNSTGISASHGAMPVCSYNNAWGNTWQDYDEQSGGAAPPGTGSISADPMEGPDFELTEGSPCIDAGDPAAIYNDLDGSRNDIGWTGGPCGSSVPPGAIVSGFVWTSIGTYANIEDIEQTGARRGLTKDRDRPFGGSPWLSGAFGFTETGIVRYAVKIGLWSGSTPPASSAFVYVDDPLSKVRFDLTGGTLTTSRVALGPFEFAGRPTYVPTRNAGNIIWAHENLKVVLNTIGLADGTYSVRMEALDGGGNPIPFTVNDDIIMTVNNRRPAVSIDSVSYNGSPPFSECSFITLPSDTSTLDFEYTAHHADGFLDDYQLLVQYGRNRSGGYIVTDDYSAHTASNGVWNGETNTMVAATPVSPAQPLPNLQPWKTCAYQFRIRAWARTTNGFGRLYWTSFFDTYVIDLRPPLVSGPDLDGDGDVDAEDLAILAEAYGTVR